MIVWVWVLGLVVVQLHKAWLIPVVIGLIASPVVFTLGWHAQAFKKALICIVVFGLAVVRVVVLEQSDSWILPPELIKKDVDVDAEIISIPKHSTHADRFTVALKSWQGKPNASHLQLSWYGKHPPITVGDIWHWTVRLTPPHGLSNPGGFHWQQWFRYNHIMATGYIVASRPALRLTHHNDIELTRYRQQWSGAIQQVVRQPQLAAIISALTLGVRTSLSQAQWVVLQRTGTSHLVAVSGLHIALIAMTVYQCVFWLWCRLPSLVLRVPAPYVATLVSLVAAFAYALLSGWGLPAQRACIMLSCVLLGQCSAYAFPVWKRLQWAFVIIVTMTPAAVVTASFWLSFVAVAWIGYALWGQQVVLPRFIRWLRVQSMLFLGLLPLNLYYFSQLSWISCIANAVAIPWMSFIVLPLSLVAVVAYICCAPLGCLLLHLAAALLSPLWLLLSWVAGWPPILWQHVINPMMVCVLLLATLLLLAPKGFIGRWFAVALFLPLIWPHVRRPLPSDAWVTVLDVGQGLAVVVQTAHHLLLYDAGAHSYGGFDAGRDVVLPYLRYLHQGHIDLMMISHGDNDHIGGAPAILRAMPVAAILTSVPGKLSLWNPKACYQGQQWWWDGVHFDVIWPPPDMPYRGNNSSCVLRISAHNKTILLPGDIEHMAEWQLVHDQASKLKADIVLAPHHGSATSSGDAFVLAVSPSDVIYSAGFYNRYHFPAQSVVERYSKQGSEQYVTFLGGAIYVRLLAKGGVELCAFKGQKQREFPYDNEL